MPRKRRRTKRTKRYLSLWFAAILGTQCLLYWALTSKRIARVGADPLTTPAAHCKLPAPPCRVPQVRSWWSLESSALSRPSPASLAERNLPETAIGELLSPGLTVVLLTPAIASPSPDLVSPNAPLLAPLETPEPPTALTVLFAAIRLGVVAFAPRQLNVFAHWLTAFGPFRAQDSVTPFT